MKKSFNAKIDWTIFQGARKGTNLRGQTEPKRRSPQKTADFRRKPQKTAGIRRKPQIGVCPLRFVPLSAALILVQYTFRQYRGHSLRDSFLTLFRGLAGPLADSKGRLFSDTSRAGAAFDSCSWSAGSQTSRKDCQKKASEKSLTVEKSRSGSVQIVADRIRVTLPMLQKSQPFAPVLGECEENPPPPPYTREIGTMWQIGVLAGKPCTFLVQNGSFSAFWHYKNQERLSRGLGVKWHIPSTCLDASRKWFFSTGIYSIKRAFEWLCLETQQTPLNGENVHGFLVRTPICHIVPVSRAYPYTKKKKGKKTKGNKQINHNKGRFLPSTCTPTSCRNLPF